MAAVSAGSAVAAEAGAAEAYAAQDPQYDATTTARGSMMPLWVALGAVLAGWVWLLLDDDEDNDEADVPVSP